MSLRVWLPLTKDLRQQGLDNVTVTNNGATFNSAGKLGGCYSFGTGNSYITVDSTPLKTFTEFSFACWVKIISWNTSYSTIFAAKNSTSTSWNNLIFSLLRNSSNSTLCFNIAGSGGYTSTNCQTGTLSLDTWYHITCTYKSGQIKLYQDGSVVSTHNTSVVPSFSSIVNLWIGKSNENTYQSNNLLNDVRIYDHCLSPMEVKELAKGLVLHYPLNRQGWGQENLVVNYRNNGNAAYYSTTLSAQVYEVDSSMPSGYHQKCTIGTASGTGGPYWVGTTTNGNTGTQISQLTADAWYTVSYYIKGTTTHSSVITTTAEFLKNITFVERPTINTGWQRVTFYGQYNGNTTSGVAITIYEGSKWTAGEVFYFSSLKVEPGKIRTQWIPHNSDTFYTTMGLNSTTEYDCSGFCNNGTRTGTFTWTSDTPKYQVSTYMPKAALITHPRPVFGGTDQEWTCAMWVKLDNITQVQQAMNNFNIFNNIVHSTTPLLYLNDGTNDYYMYGSQAVSAGVWTHVAFVFKNSDGTRNIYINGVLRNNYGPNKTSTPRGIPDTVTVGTNLAGYISDYRVYATALSADDVKSLYQNSAYIDSSGNVYGAVHSEV